MKAWSNEHLSLLTNKQLLKARDYVARNMVNATAGRNKQRALENIEGFLRLRGIKTGKNFKQEASND